METKGKERKEEGKGRRKEGEGEERRKEGRKGKARILSPLEKGEPENIKRLTFFR
jgi:hypothetical protein